MIRLVVSAVAVTLVAGLGGLPAQAGARESLARAGKNCAPPKYPGSGYFTSLKVTGTACSRGKAVTLAHYRCRIKKGRGGKCSSRVLGYRCSERRTTISTEINAIVTCRRGDAQVRYSYQQNT